MDYLTDWDRARREVDIEQYFLFKMGGHYRFDKYKMAYVQENGGQHGDIIRFFTHEKSGVKMYYSIVYQDSGDIIQFIRKRILNNDNPAAGEINREINSFNGLLADFKANPSYIRQIRSMNGGQKGQFYIANGDIIPEIEEHNHYFSSYRKLSLDLLNSEQFKGIFFTYRTYNTESLSFQISDIEGNRVGIVRIQTSEGEYFNKKWFDKNSRNSIGFSFSNYLPNAETLSVFESLFDAMSFQEMFPEDKAQYCSTNGELGFRKARLIKEHYYNKEFKRLKLGNDNDLAGNYFNLNIVSAFIPQVSGVRKSEKNICIEFQSDIADVKPKMLSNFFKKSGIKYEINDQSEFPQSYFTETLSQNGVGYFFTIPNTVESIRFVIDLMFRIWDLDKFISIKTPINKDFNEDLIQSKTKGHG